MYWKASLKEKLYKFYYSFWAIITRSSPIIIISTIDPYFEVSFEKKCRPKMQLWPRLESWNAFTRDLKATFFSTADLEGGSKAAASAIKCGRRCVVWCGSSSRARVGGQRLQATGGFLGCIGLSGVGEYAEKWRRSFFTQFHLLVVKVVVESWELTLIGPNAGPQRVLNSHSKAS